MQVALPRTQAMEKVHHKGSYDAFTNDVFAELFTWI
jgi:hypothetical protein